MKELVISALPILMQRPVTPIKMKKKLELIEVAGNASHVRQTELNSNALKKFVKAMKSKTASAKSLPKPKHVILMLANMFPKTFVRRGIMINVTIATL